MGSNFLANFFQLFGQFIHPKGQEGILVYYLGEFYSALNLPWHYLFTWLLLTIPVLTLLLFVFSLFRFFIKLKDDLYFLNTVAIIIILLLNIYIKIPDWQGIRQYLFLIPLISLNAAIFLVELVYKTKKDIWKQLLVALLFINFANTAYTMYELYPFQYLYFSEPADDLQQTAQLMEMDYLKTSNKALSQWIIKDILQSRPTDPLVYLCEEKTPYQYYGEGIFRITQDTQNADYLVCPNLIFKIEPTYQLVRKGIILNNVTKVYHEY
jgi:hypothetical protein